MSPHLMTERPLLRPALGQAASHLNRFAAGVIASADIHRCGRSHRQRNIILNLLRPPVLLAQSLLDNLHILLCAAGKIADEVRYEELRLADRIAFAGEDAAERGKHRSLRLAHALENRRGEVLGRDLELATDMTADQRG